MIKLLKIIAIFVVMVTSMVILTGCHFETDTEIGHKNMEKLLVAIESKDRNKIKELFAPNKTPEMENLDETIDELITYYSGNFESYKSKGLGTDYDRDSGIEKKWQSMSYDVTTTKDVFRFGITWYIMDTEDKGNLGIWSCYIIRFEDDIYPKYSYRGDGLKTLGLHLGKTYLGELD